MPPRPGVLGVYTVYSQDSDPSSGFDSSLLIRGCLLLPSRPEDGPGWWPESHVAEPVLPPTWLFMSRLLSLPLSTLPKHLSHAPASGLFHEFCFCLGPLTPVTSCLLGPLLGLIPVSLLTAPTCSLKPVHGGTFSCHTRSGYEWCAAEDLPRAGGPRTATHHNQTVE